MREPSRHAVAARYVFDGFMVHENAAVMVEGARIIAVVPRADLPGNLRVQALPNGAWLAPGFIDLQVNGGGDTLFNDSPTAETIAHIAGAHRKFGTTALLPTFISDTPAKMTAALAAVQEAVDAQPSVLGIHLEGPFLSPAKAGAHDPRAIRLPTDEDERHFATPRKGRMLLTVAPEELPPEFLARQVRRGVQLALGHSMATYAQTQRAMAEGLTGFTHLFNAMRPMSAREGGPIAAALESSDAWYSLIADGVHVDPAMLQLALRGRGRPVLVTDAMPPVGGSRSRFQLYDQEITLQGDRCTREDGVLAGSALNMAKAVRNSVRWLDVTLTDALRFASVNPASVLGLGHVLGHLTPGFRADMVAFDPDGVEVIATWVAGK
jgi:N-acetylglucosamine-6-phosphate deacetylase